MAVACSGTTEGYIDIRVAVARQTGVKIIYLSILLWKLWNATYINVCNTYIYIYICIIIYLRSMCFYFLPQMRSNNNNIVRSKRKSCLAVISWQSYNDIGNYNTYVYIIRERVRLSGREIGKHDWISNL